MYYLRSHCFYLLCFEDQTLPKITKDGLSNKDWSNNIQAWFTIQIAIKSGFPW
jgi:hypothetical protein